MFHNNCYFICNHVILAILGKSAYVGRGDKVTFRNNQVTSNKILRSGAHIIPVRVMGEIL